MLFEVTAGSVGNDPSGAANFSSRCVLGRDQDIAIVDSGQTITHGELRERIGSLAAAIRQMHDGIENPVVAIAMPQGLDFIIALLGSLESGSLVVPLDMAIPSKRMEVILGKAAPDLVIANTTTRMDLQSHSQRWKISTLEDLSRDTCPPVCVSSVLSSKGVVLYTSGSTGEPKGVLVSGEMLIREARTLIDRLGIEKEDRISNLLSPSVIGGLREIFTGLLAGAALYPFRVKELGLNSLIKQLQREEITICRMVSSLFRSFCHALAPDDHLSFRRLYIGGEPLVASDVALFRKHFSPECQLSNVFGATEFGLVTHYIVPADFEKSDAQTVPIGSANEGYRLTVVDEAGKEVPHGTPGRLVVAGECIAEGYWLGANAPIDPFCELSDRPGWRVFETSDLVRLDPSGQFEYLGRTDTQTKIAGNRVELIQVENILRRSKNVLDAVVISLEFGGRKDLYAIVERNEGTTEDLISICKEHLPDPAVPRRIIECSSIPKSFQGKCDRRAVAQLVQEHLERSPAGSDSIASSNSAFVDRMEILEQLWRRAHGIPNEVTIEPDCEFQADSLSTLEFLIHIRNQLKTDLSPLELKACKTFGLLAKFIGSPHSLHQPTTPSHCVRLSELHPGPALFLLHGASGEVGIYKHLVDVWRPAVTVYGVNANKDLLLSEKQLTFSSVVNSAIQSIRNQQPSGPYLLAGYSFGGVLAYEIARELSSQGVEVAFCGMLDSFLPYHIRYPKSLARYLSIAMNFPSWFRDALLNNQIVKNWRRHQRQADSPLQRLGNPSVVDQARKELVHGLLWACDNHIPTPSRIDLWVYRSKVRPLLHSHSVERQWKETTGANIQCTTLPGNHTTMMKKPPYVAALADALREDITDVLKGKNECIRAR